MSDSLSMVCYLERKVIFVVDLKLFVMIMLYFVHTTNIQNIVQT